MLFSKLPRVKGIDANVSRGLFEADVLECVWDQALLRGYQMFGGLGQNSEND